MIPRYEDIGAGMGKQPTAAEITEKAYRTVRTFWETYGAGLREENGPGTFNHNFVQKMGGLYEDIAAVGSIQTVRYDFTG